VGESDVQHIPGDCHGVRLRTQGRRYERGKELDGVIANNLFFFVWFFHVFVYLKQ
jgi:hypothetical protein